MNESDALYNELLSWLGDVCRRRTDDENDFQTLAYEISVKFVRYRDRIPATLDDTKPWLYRVVVNTHIDLIRKGNLPDKTVLSLDEPLPGADDNRTRGDILADDRNTIPGSDAHLVDILLANATWWELDDLPPLAQIEEDFEKILKLAEAIARNKNICAACVPHIFDPIRLAKQEIAELFNVSRPNLTYILGKMRAEFRRILDENPDHYPWLSWLKPFWISAPHRDQLTPRTEWMLECLGYILDQDEAVAGHVDGRRDLDCQRLSPEETAAFEAYAVHSFAADAIVEATHLKGTKELEEIVAKGCTSLWGFIARNADIEPFRQFKAQIDAQKGKKGPSAVLYARVKRSDKHADVDLNAVITAALEEMTAEWKREPAIPAQRLQAFLEAYFACYENPAALPPVENALWADVGRYVYAQMERCHTNLLTRLHNHQAQNKLLPVEQFVLNLAAL